MGLALKKMTEGDSENPNEEDKEEEDDEDKEKSIKENDWSIFCTNQLKIFETKWTKKLEDYGPDDNREDSVFKFKTTPK